MMSEIWLCSQQDLLGCLSPKRKIIIFASRQSAFTIACDAPRPSPSFFIPTFPLAHRRRRDRHSGDPVKTYPLTKDPIATTVVTIRDRRIYLFLIGRRLRGWVVFTPLRVVDSDDQRRERTGWFSCFWLRNFVVSSIFGIHTHRLTSHLFSTIGFLLYFV